MAEISKLLTLDVWGKNEQWIYDYISAKDAQAIKSVALSADHKHLYFYKITNPTVDSVPAFTIDLPEPDLADVLRKITGAGENNVTTFNATGGIKDSGVAIADLARKTEVSAEIAKKISEVSHMKKEIVQELPNSKDADANTFYLIKVDTVTGKDKYEIWTLIGDELICIDDTTVDLTGYITSGELATALATIKSEAIASAVEQAAADATEKANKALSDAKAYTDSKVTPLTNRVTELETAKETIENNITNINNTLHTHDERIKAVEAATGNIDFATEAEALDMFNKIFYPTT